MRAPDSGHNVEELYRCPPALLAARSVRDAGLGDLEETDQLAPGRPWLLVSSLWRLGSAAGEAGRATPSHSDGHRRLRPARRRCDAPRTARSTAWPGAAAADECAFVLEDCGMRAVLEGLNLKPDPSTLHNDSADFALPAQMIVGPPVTPGEESFDITVCTPERLAKACSQVAASTTLGTISSSTSRRSTFGRAVRGYRRGYRRSRPRPGPRSASDSDASPTGSSRTTAPDRTSAVTSRLPETGGRRKHAPTLAARSLAAMTRHSSR